MKYPAIKKQDPSVFKILKAETLRQEEELQLIASENYASPAVMEAQGSVMTNKYAEGYPGRRYYQGMKHYDEVENLAIERAKKIFGAEHVNVQPSSGSQANMAATLAVLEHGDTLMGMDLACGGHLTHGMKLNYSGQMFKVASYPVRKDDFRLDYDQIMGLAREARPKLIICGASAYPRTIDFAAFRRIADEVEAVLLADIAHIAGLVAGGAHPSPFPHADIVTTTTHKTLRGPRGGMILCKEAFAKKVDSRVFPGIQGGPLMHAVAAKAVAFGEALKPSFKRYAAQVVKNAQELAKELSKRGYSITTGGTDNHLMLVDLRSKGVTGKDAAYALEEAGMILNKNGVPFDDAPPQTTSGIRLGSAGVSTRGMKEKQMRQIAEWMDIVISRRDEAKLKARVKNEVAKLCRKFPVYA
ncbi:MAG TPA: serine hydroxymethyltransferase [bacterium]|jgi:glycine hydroxymethyltransferase|nr:serine hydroxymethyltransferase [bacterium]